LLHNSPISSLHEPITIKALFAQALLVAIMLVWLHLWSRSGSGRHHADYHPTSSLPWDSLCDTMMLANSLKFTRSILITSYKHVGNVQKLEKMISYIHSSIAFRLVKNFKEIFFSKTLFCLKESEASFEIFWSLLKWIHQN
jgi:hypothetical protein